MSASAVSAPQNTGSAPAGSSRGNPRRRRPPNRHRPPNTQPESGLQDGQLQPQPQALQRGGRRGGRGQPASASRPQAVPAPEPTPIPASDAATAENPQPRGGRRGRGGNRGATQNGRGGHARTQPAQPRMGYGGRQFGGQLTVDEGTASASGQSTHPAPSDLQGDAPAFQPGQPIVPRNKPRAPRQRKPKAPKSTAPDIATRTHEDIDNDHYECAICTEEVRRNSRAWSCRTCWTVFHLGCIKKWSTKEGAAAARQQAQDGEMPPPRQWRCPGCNLPKDVLPHKFSCWCEKEEDPKSMPGLPPFSCGQTCSRPRILPKKCPHPCPSVCHAGPCPPCTQMGPTQSCFCGKKSVTRRCIDTDYENGWSCGDVCGELMPCGEHYCEQPCHEGLCGACEVRVPARCYCGQIQKEILCCDRGDEEECSRSHVAADGTTVTEHWTGLFECPNTCNREFDCGKHHCEKPCHIQDEQLPHCPRSPDVVSHCPCGKTPLAEISDKTRQTCQDPIPNCSKPCGKMLDCGHSCQEVCHQGNCMACMQTVSISCRCGRTTHSTICHQGTDEPPQCMRICRVSLNCGRHECGERCCTGERKASERQSSRRKLRPLQSAPRQPDDGFEAEHICTRVCGRQLKCGNPNHRCQELCHKGPCGSCRDAIFDEVSCNCGRTVLQPPLPCGTKPPPCRFQCERPKACGHPQVSHTCHMEEDECPKCPYLTTKRCLCGKNSVKNQPCWLNDVRCGGVCGRRLRCGAHTCRKQCHRPGECEEPCQQPCGKELSSCGHPCMAPCHSPSTCKEEKPCQHKIFITCECQRIKQEAKCNASRNGNGNLKKSLKCDEECARLERNRKLALALNVDPANHQDDHIPYSADTMKMYQEDSTWTATREKEFRLFAAKPEEKRLRFKPMPAHQRAFLHSIAEDFGFDHESMDPEPHRHVAIFKTPRFVMAPMKTLAECARIKSVQRVTTGSGPAVAASSQPRAKPSNLEGAPHNAFLVTNPRFALTNEEVNAAIRTALPNQPFTLEISFLPSEEVVLRPPLTIRANTLDHDLQSTLESLKPALAQTFASSKIGNVQLARLDSSLNVLRKESDAGPGAGWSQVAAKGAPLRKIEKGTPIGSKGGFAVLSLSSTKKKKQKEKEADVVDDWMAAELEEEEKEKVASGASGASGTTSGIHSPEEAGTPLDTELPPAADAVGESTGVSGSGRWADMDDDCSRSRGSVP